MEEQAVVNNPIQQPPVNPVPVSKKPNHWLIAIIILVIIFIVGGVYVLALQSQKQNPVTVPLPLETSVKKEDPTANWKTYTNTKYGFEFKHPSWAESTGTFESYFPGGSDLVLTLLNGQSLNNHEGVSVHSNIEVIDKLPNMSLQERLETKYSIKGGQKGNIDIAYQQNQQLSEYYWTVMKPQQKAGTVIEYPKGKLTYNEYILNGIQIYEIGDPGGVFSYMTFFIPQNKNYIYLLTLELSGAGNGKTVEPPDSYFIETYKQMVKTFKFTNQGGTVCAQDAKLCPNGSYVSRQGPNCEFAPCP